jgi:hypothetical protein
VFRPRVLIFNGIRRGDRLDHCETVRRRNDGTLIDVSLTISVEALANVHSPFLQSHWTVAELGSLVSQELSPY